MKVKAIEVGMILNLGDNESKKLSIRAEVEDFEVPITVYTKAQKLLAQWISNDDPEVYKKCLEKLGYNCSAGEYKELIEQWENNCRKINVLKDDLVNSQQWLLALTDAKEKKDKLKLMLEASNAWSDFNTVLNALANSKFNKKLESFHSTEDSIEELYNL